MRLTDDNYRYIFLENKNEDISSALMFHETNMNIRYHLIYLMNMIR